MQQAGAVVALVKGAVAPDGLRSAVGGRRSAVGGRRSAVGGRRSAVGGRRSAVGGRRSAVGPILASPEKRQHMAQQARTVGRPDAADRLTDLLLSMGA